MLKSKPPTKGENQTPLTPTRQRNAPFIKCDVLLDSACGSGNFLTETYLSLRKIENIILAQLNDDQQALGFEDVGISPVKVSLDQFYGLEINDFAVRVASTALWIAELQANAETAAIVTRTIEDLPLRESAHIRQANALTTDWTEVLDPGRCSYVLGNPPFLGARNQGGSQKPDLTAALAEAGATKNVGNIDYVGGWYAKAARYSVGTDMRCAFVSTNSIVQGEQVANLWYPLSQLGVHIDFAHDTFRWSNESTSQAHVFCVIVGFSHGDRKPKTLFHHEGPDAPAEKRVTEQLNYYLAPAKNTFVRSRTKPLSDVPNIGIGNKPVDGGIIYSRPRRCANLLRANLGRRNTSVLGLDRKNLSKAGSCGVSTWGRQSLGISINFRLLWIALELFVIFGSLEIVPQRKKSPIGRLNSMWRRFLRELR